MRRKQSSTVIEKETRIRDITKQQNCMKKSMYMEQLIQTPLPVKPIVFTGDLPSQTPLQSAILQKMQPFFYISIHYLQRPRNTHPLIDQQPVFNQHPVESSKPAIFFRKNIFLLLRMTYMMAFSYCPLPPSIVAPTIEQWETIPPIQPPTVHLSGEQDASYVKKVFFIFPAMFTVLLT